MFQPWEGKPGPEGTKESRRDHVLLSSLTGVDSGGVCSQRWDLASPSILGRYPPQKAGTTSTFSPGPITRSAPLAQTESFNNSLNVSFSAPGAVHRHVLRLTHSQGTPRSQLKPGPWPRR